MGRRLSTYHDAAAMIRSARHLVFFTGAGISTPSGIPDFRSTRQGLWTQSDPMQVASLSVFLHDPGKFYEWYRTLLQAASTALPNPAHEKIAEIEQVGLVKSVITQNIDGLHQAAGSQNVIELHGTMRRYFCPQCGEDAQNPLEVTKLILDGKLPHCKACESILKPAITLFEESLPLGAWEGALQEVYNADVLLVAGSSLEVAPASSLPWTAVRQGCRLIMINFSPTEIDGAATILLHEDVSKALPEILSLIQQIKAAD